MGFETFKNHLLFLGTAEASVRLTLKAPFLPFLFMLLILSSGCIPVMQNNFADLEMRARKLKNISVLAPKIKVYELSAGDVSELRDDWSAVGTGNTEKSVIAELKRKGVSASILRPKSAIKEEYEDLMLLYDAVMASVYRHTVVRQGNPEVFPEKIRDFDYAVGSLDSILSGNKADGLLIVSGSDEISTSGRKALRVVQAINPFAQAQMSGVTFIEAALVDRKGNILWWESFANSGGYDLRDPNSAGKFVTELLDRFPGGGK